MKKKLENSYQITVNNRKIKKSKTKTIYTSKTIKLEELLKEIIEKITKKKNG